MSGDRRRLARASFGPEWSPLGIMAHRLLDACSTREQSRLRAHLRAIRRDYANGVSR